MGMYAAIATVAGTGGIPPHFLVYYFNDRSARLLVFVVVFFFFANYSSVAFCQLQY